MSPRQARRERREAERKEKKLEQKKIRLAGNQPFPVVETAQPQSTAPSVGTTRPATPATTETRAASPRHAPTAIFDGGSCLDPEFPQIQPRWNPELEDEFPREVQIRHNALADRISLQAGLSIPPPGPSASTFTSVEQVRQHLLAKRKAAAQPQPPVQSEDEAPLGTHAKTPDLPGFVSQPHPDPGGFVPQNGFVSQNAPALPTRRAEINRANARHSTGPTSPAGKLTSSRNSTKHGLAAGTPIIQGEDPAAFEALLNDLTAEHQPANPTEQLLIQELAQSHWLTQRAIRLQNTCFTGDGVNERQLALFLRYQTTHQRAFHKALHTLLKLKKEAARIQRGFVSQPVSQTAKFARRHEPSTGSVSQNDPLHASPAGFVSQDAPDSDQTEASEMERQAA